MNSGNLRLPKSNCNVSFDKEITRWDEGLPLGNGETGCLIWGSSRELRFSLDRGDIWDKTPTKEVLEKDFTYAELLTLVRAEKTEEIRKRFDIPYTYPTPTKLPAGKLIFDFGEREAIRSTLDLASAEVTVSIVGADKTITVKSHLHATKKVGMIAIDAPLSAFSYHIKNPEFSLFQEGAVQEKAMLDSVETGSLKLLYYPAPTVCDEPLEKFFIQPIQNGFAYGVFLMACEAEGHTEIAYRVATSNDGEHWCEDAKALVTDLLKNGYAASFDAHTAWWSAYWSNSSVSLPDILFEKNWYLTNYLLASCSRKGSFPMPLQGVWTADNGALPPWKGDYHNDLNTQMCYYSYLKANHMDEGESFVDFLWDLVPVARDFAKTFFQSKGLCLPAVMAIDGTALCGWPMYALNATNQLWLCQAFERHFRFSGDLEFLREKAYVYCAESMECVLGILEVDESGNYRLPASSSSEIHDNTAASWLSPNSNYDLSMMRYVTIQLIRFSKLLENGREGYWQELLQKLPQLALDDRNVLMISPDEVLTESHRHHAHAMAIHPLRLLDYGRPEDKKVIDATVLNLEQLGTGFWCGYSFSWMAEFYAIQGNGNGAAYQLESFWRNTCSPNGFHLNGDYKNRGVSQFHYRPFTLEGNMCAADAVQEMLLQTENNTLTFFPAIPEEWMDEEISFADFRAENGLLVSASMCGGRICSITLKPKFTGKLTIKNFRAVKHLFDGAGIEAQESGDSAEILPEGGKVYIFQ